MEAASLKPRHELVRILLFLGFTLGVQAVTLLCEIVLYLLSMIVAQLLGFTGDILDVVVFTFVLIFLAVGPAIAAVCNRCFTFRAKDKWWPGSLLMAGLTILFALLVPRVSWATAVLWLIAAYVLQRWVLYRKTLDTLHDSPDEMEAANE